MDIQKLRHAVFEKTGIRIDEIDPVFAVVALNEVMFEELMVKYQEAAKTNIEEIDERIGSLVVMHRNLITAAHDLAERASQAHMASALKAATDARTEIMNAARVAVSAEVEKASLIVTNAAHQLAAAGDKVHAKTARGWTQAIVQAVIGGIVTGIVVLAVLHFRL